jgi:dihydropteroate synthase
MAEATPFASLPVGSGTGIPERDLGETRIGPSVFRWGARTYVMGIINVTPDSFSGDGILSGARARAPGQTLAGARPATDRDTSGSPPPEDYVQEAVEQGRRMAREGADLLDVGGESTRPGHDAVDEGEEIERVVPVIRALRAVLPDMPLSVDTVKTAVALAALDAGADLLNDVWGTDGRDTLARVAADRGVPIVLMHNRREARYTNVLAEVLADLQRALERALDAGVAWEHLIVDPGMGFGKTAEHNLAVLGDLAQLRLLRRPVLLGISRKSTIGRVLDVPADQRLEGTLAVTALGIAAGVDIVRVHDVEANRRAARMSDAIVRR